MKSNGIHSRSGGAGGQNVNKVESGVPYVTTGKILNTGIVEEILIECTKLATSQRTRERALSRLRTFIYDKEHQKYIDDIASKRKTMVSTGDRSAKIRTTTIHKDVSLTTASIIPSITWRPSWTVTFWDCIDHLIVAENAERLKESEL